VAVAENALQADTQPVCIIRYNSWWRCTVVKRWSFTGKLSLSHARPAADG